MAIKYISYDPNVLEGQAILDNFVRTQRILRYRDNGKVFERISAWYATLRSRKPRSGGQES